MIPERAHVIMKAPARRKIATVVTAPTAAPHVLPTAVAESDIARRAYELYEQRGCTHGHEMHDWLRAERELRKSI